jgi:penicillin-binding protein 1C
MEHPLLSPASIFYVFEALTNAEKPDTETGWKTFATSRKVAWKTGTSYGFRDAWAIGVTPEYVVAVWVGNATGEGRPGIIGGSAAAPVMFELFRLLPCTGWFDTPYDDMEPAVVCRKSGFIASQYCDETDTLYLPVTGNPKPTCKYHRLIHLSADEKYRVNADCYPVSSMKHKSWFVLPPVMEWYYKSVDPTYKKLPPRLPGCKDEGDSPMSMIYPKNNTKVFIPVDFDGKLGRVVVKATHRSPGTTIYWYLDDEYIGETKEIHNMEILPDEGWHTITLTDSAGNRFVRRFYCTGRGRE